MTRRSFALYVSTLALLRDLLDQLGALATHLEPDTTEAQKHHGPRREPPELRRRELRGASVVTLAT